MGDLGGAGGGGITTRCRRGLQRGENPILGKPNTKAENKCQRMLPGALFGTHESWTIDFPSAFGVYEEVYQGWDEGTPVASEKILPLLSPHAL